MNKKTLIKTIEDYGILINILEDYISKRDRVNEITNVEILDEDYLLVQYNNYSMGYLYNESIEIPIKDIITNV